VTSDDSVKNVEARLARRRELYRLRRETDPEWVERRRKRQRDWYREKYRTDEEFAQRERDRCYWDLSGLRYNAKLLKDRGYKALKRRRLREQGICTKCGVREAETFMAKCVRCQRYTTPSTRTSATRLSLSRREVTGRAMPSLDADADLQPSESSCPGIAPALQRPMRPRNSRR
jgi:hypothetical protein